jgi:hypothetical protein
VDKEVVRLAASQDDVLSVMQLHKLGADRSWIDRRVAMGWLAPVFRGVYGIGHPPRTRRGWQRAALLAGGERSVLSHTTAAAIHEMGETSGRLHLTIPRTAHGIEGIRTHRPRTLRPDDVVIVDGLRVTSPARTLIDLADFGKRRMLERAIDQAEYHRLHLPLGDVDDRAHRRPRSRLLRAVIATHVAGSTITESEAEELFLAIVRRAGLPLPESQVTLWGPRRDFVFRAQKVVVNDHRPLRFTRRAVKYDQRYVELALRTVLHGSYSPTCGARRCSFSR